MDAGQASVRILIVTSRNPWPPFSGDRLRTTMWLDALAEDNEVVLVTRKGASRPTRPGVRIEYVSWRPWALIGAMARVIGRNLPLHTLLLAGYGWRESLRRVERDHGPFDAAVVVLSRLDPWVFAELPATRRVLDAIDSLTHSMEERSRQAPRWFRWFWRHEQRTMKALELDASRRYDSVLVVDEGQAAFFAGKTSVVPIGVVLQPLKSHKQRRFDFAFWGRLAYFANHDAANYLVTDIWPRIRRRHPRATLVLAGADAPRSLRRLDGREGITVVSPARNISELARDVKIGLFPIRYGTGQLTKIVEAAEAGCAIVASPIAMRALDSVARHSMIAETAEEFAEKSDALLKDDHGREKLGAAVREVVEREFSRAHTSRLLAATLRQERPRP
jgi:glycosyltransferase involved in cell wall biosynthesis